MVVDINYAIIGSAVVNPNGLLEIQPFRFTSVRTSLDSIGVTDRRSKITHHPSVLIGTLGYDSNVTSNGIVRGKETCRRIILSYEIAEIVVGADTEENDRRLLLTEIDGLTITEVLAHRNSEVVGSLVKLTIDMAQLVAVDAPLHVQGVARIVLNIGAVERVGGREVDLLLFVPRVVDEETDKALRVNLLCGSLLSCALKHDSIELAQFQSGIGNGSLLELLGRSTDASSKCA